MHTRSNQYGAFSIEFEAEGEKGLLTILPEMAPAKVGIKPTERYYIYCVHPVRGTCTWYQEQDNEDAWYSDRYPPFIDATLIAWIGKQIEEHK